MERGSERGEGGGGGGRWSEEKRLRGWGEKVRASL